MDTTTYRRRTAGRGSRTASRRRSGLPLRERRRLIQLAASAGLFLLVFFGRGVFPEQMAAWKSILSADVDFRGAVAQLGENSVYGLYVKLDHANGVSTFYAHCKKLLVKKGETVKCGQVIAKSGETGNATGPHLHFSVEKDGVRLNPAYYLGQT